MNSANEKIALLTLLHVKGWGRKKIWSFLQQFPSAKAIVEELKVSSDWERDLEACERENITLVTYQDPTYPKELLKIPDFPLLLYVKGKLPEPTTPCVALVGTRAASLYGKEMAEKIAHELANAGVSVVSGLARGIDTAAHIGALRRGQTIAIIGSGLGEIYPRENHSLAKKITETGALISEYPFHTPPARHLFPERNRIVSGMSRGVVLIESPGKGGSMITLNLAARQKKRCFAIPGRLDIPSFCGNHSLIQSGNADLISSTQDILAACKLSYNQNFTDKSFSKLSQEEHVFLNLLPYEEKTIDELVLLTQLPVMKLNVLLTRLILKKAVQEYPGKIYKKINQ